MALRDGLAGAGFPVLTFNYPYTEAGKKRPDTQAKLLECHRAVLAWFGAEVSERVVLAGRSMGGRMGTYLAAEGEPCDGLILFAYPLHPAGRPEKLRKDHLPEITQPMLFCVGTRDALSKMDLYDRWVRPLPDRDDIRGRGRRPLLPGPQGVRPDQRRSRGRGHRGIGGMAGGARMNSVSSP